MKSLNKFTSLAIAFFTFCFLPDLLSAQDYFPVVPGMEWTYAYTNTYDPSGAAKNTVSIGEEQVEKVDEMYYPMNNAYFSSESAEPMASVSYIRKAKDGAVYGINPSVTEEEYLFFPAETEVGSVWTGLSGSSAVAETDATVKTPVGEFENCVVIESIAGEVKAYSYYQEGKGLVAMKLGDQLMMYLKK